VKKEMEEQFFLNRMRQVKENFDFGQQGNIKQRVKYFLKLPISAK
jgi:hypothetical protein